MEIQIDPHTLERAQERGTNGVEIKDVIKTGFTIPAKYGRIGKDKVYDFKRKRLGKYYEQNRKGTWSISVSGNWRITFEFEGDDIYNLNLEDYH